MLTSVIVTASSHLLGQMQLRILKKVLRKIRLVVLRRRRPTPMMLLVMEPSSSSSS